MKKLLILIALCAMSSYGQVFYGSVIVTGTSNAPVNNAFVPITNTLTANLNSGVLAVQNVLTNQSITIKYGYTFAGRGGTNLYIAQSFTTNFYATNGWVSGSTWTYQIPQANLTIPLIPYGQIELGNATNTVLWY
jgi:hypothetical protein